MLNRNKQIGTFSHRTRYSQFRIHTCTNFEVEKSLLCACGRTPDHETHPELHQLSQSNQLMKLSCVRKKKNQLNLSKKQNCRYKHYMHTKKKKKDDFYIVVETLGFFLFLFALQCFFFGGVKPVICMTDLHMPSYFPFNH